MKAIIHRVILAIILLVNLSNSVLGADFSKFKGLYKPTFSTGVFISRDLFSLDLENKENNWNFKIYYDDFVIVMKSNGMVTGTATAAYARTSGYLTSATFPVKFKGRLTSLKTLTQYVQAPQTAKFRMTGDDGSIATATAVVWPKTKATDLTLTITRNPLEYSGQSNFTRFKR